MQYFQEDVEVLGPVGGQHAAAHGIFQHQVPADDPGEEFAERGVSVGIGAAGDWRHGGKFGIAQGGQGTAKPGNSKGDHHGRSAPVGSSFAGHDEDAGTDDG